MLPIADVVVAPIVERVEQPVLQHELVSHATRAGRYLGEERVHEGAKELAVLLADRTGKGVLVLRLPVGGGIPRELEVHHPEIVPFRREGLGALERARRTIRMVVEDQLPQQTVVGQPDQGRICWRRARERQRLLAGRLRQPVPVDALSADDLAAGRCTVPRIDVQRVGATPLHELPEVHRDRVRVQHHVRRKPFSQGQQHVMAAVVDTVPRRLVAVGGIRAVSEQLEPGTRLRLPGGPRILQRDVAEVLVRRYLLRGCYGGRRSERGGDER
jgi:hypothetical protein